MLLNLCTQSNFIEMSKVLAYTHTNPLDTPGECFQREMWTLKSMTRCSMACSAPLSLFHTPPNPKSDIPDSPESFDYLEFNEECRTRQLKSYIYAEASHKTVSTSGHVWLLRTEHCLRHPNSTVHWLETAFTGRVHRGMWCTGCICRQGQRRVGQRLRGPPGGTRVHNVSSVV